MTRTVELKNLEASHNAIEIANEDQVASYFKIRQQLDNLSKQLLSYIQKPQHLLPFLQPGRLVKVTHSLYVLYIFCSVSKKNPPPP